ncbi:MAG: hypothetical protein WC878_04010 [Candidatus Paceibacterota bacterium]|jgi:hypothetical protein
MLKVWCEKCKHSFERQESDFKCRTAYLFYVQCPMCEHKIFHDEIKEMSYSARRVLLEKFKSKRLF